MSRHDLVWIKIMLLHEDDLPVLNAVVQTGDHSIIQSTRLGNEVLRELETLRQNAIRGLPANDNQDTVESLLTPEGTSESATLSAESEFRAEHGGEASANAPSVEFPLDLDFDSLSNQLDSELTQAAMLTVGEQIKDEEIDVIVDDIVDRHITALRRDVKQLLIRARSSP